jgi:uncharacterized protein YyaL (SSP411 family)
MTLTANELQTAALRLHGHLARRHADGPLRGPDPGIRFNARIGRFVKSYLPFLPWRDQYAYMQAQGYWIQSNWLLAEQVSAARELALAASDYVLATQQPAGYWRYPNPEWKTRIATVEGCFASIGLLESYQHTGQEEYLAAADKWYDYVLRETGFQQTSSGLAVNYFAHHGDLQVPNNSTLLLYLLAKFKEAAGDDRYLEKAAPMVAWLSDVQLESGELPYGVRGAPDGAGDRIHFLCYQYNAFEFMDLVVYYQVTGDDAVLSVLRRLAAYLAGGLTPRGCGKYDCHHDAPEVAYYTLAVAQALSQASRLDLGDYRDLAERAYRQVLDNQRADGRFVYHSRANYGVLRDSRSYPRYLSMMLYHLLLESSARRREVEAVAAPA